MTREEEKQLRTIDLHTTPVPYVSYMALIVMEQVGCSFTVAIRAAQAIARHQPGWPQAARTVEEWIEWEQTRFGR